MCIANTVFTESNDSSMLIPQFALGQNRESFPSILTVCPLSFLILPFHLLAISRSLLHQNSMYITCFPPF
jgi:hypothetical protein